MCPIFVDSLRYRIQIKHDGPVDPRIHCISKQAQASRQSSRFLGLLTRNREHLGSGGKKPIDEPGKQP